MADQSAGSPWDEPLPKDTEVKKPTPTIIGDLDVGKNQNLPKASATEPAELNVPTDIEEKVGAKVNVADTVSSASVQPTESVTPTTSQLINTSRMEAPATNKTADSDFWQSIYGQNSNIDKDLSTNPSVPTEQKTASMEQPAPNVATKLGPENLSPVREQPVATNLSQPPAVQSAAQIPLSKPQIAAKQNIATKPKKLNKLSKYILVGALGLVAIFSTGVFLTEKGLLSVGLEKIYGAIKLESLWGGLPANAENAFAISALKMQEAKNFKITGSATITVDKGTKSEILTPIISAVSFPVTAMKDEKIGKKIDAVLTASDEEEWLDDEGSLLEDGEEIITEDDTGSGSSTSTSGSIATDNSATSSGSNSNAETKSDDSSEEQSDTSSLTTVEELEVEINSQITDSVSGVDLSIKSSKAKNSTVELVYENGKMHFKTSSDIKFGNQTAGKWSYIELEKISSEDPIESLWNSDFTGADFSIVGGRKISESINGIRCFHYSGQVTIGDTLNAFGLKNDSVSDLSIDYWIGVNDHLLRRITMKIIPDSSSAASRIDLALDFSEYNNENFSYSSPKESALYSPLASSDTIVTGDNKRKADLATIAKALEKYYSSNNSYPKVSGVEKIYSSGVLYSALVPKYLETMPLDPNNPNNYYGYESDGESYSLSSVLEDLTDKTGTQVGKNYLYILSSP